MNTLIAFSSAHSAALDLFAISILDFLFAINPKTKANGLLHFVYIQLTNLRNILFK